MITADAEGSPHNPVPHVYGIITAAFFTVSIAYTVRYGYGMLLPGMLNDLQITKTEAGVISATYFAAYTISSPVVGLLSDRSSPRLIITFFSVLLALGTLLMGFVNSVFQASVVFGLVGIGHAACWAPVMAICGILLGIGCLFITLLPGTSGKTVGVVMVGLGFGAVWPVYAAAAVDFFPRSQAGSVIGLWTVFLGVGSVLSPIVCGWTIDITNSYGPAFQLGFIGGMLSVVLLLPLRRLT